MNRRRASIPAFGRHVLLLPPGFLPPGFWPPRSLCEPRFYPLRALSWRTLIGCLPLPYPYMAITPLVSCAAFTDWMISALPYLPVMPWGFATGGLSLVRARRELQISVPLFFSPTSLGVLVHPLSKGALTHDIAHEPLLCGRARN